MSKARAEIAPHVPRTALSMTEAAASLGLSWDFFKEHVAPNVRIVYLGRRKLVPVRELDERWLAKEAAPPAGVGD